MVGLPDFRSHSKPRPFATQPLFDPWKSRRVRISNPHLSRLEGVTITLKFKYPPERQKMCPIFTIIQKPFIKTVWVMDTCELQAPTQENIGHVLYLVPTCKTISTPQMTLTFLLNYKKWIKQMQMPFPSLRDVIHEWLL